MADNIYYHFSDEEENMDQILIQAMERWEQMGGGGVVSPLFKFKMVPIGKRRTWRDVVRRDTFHAELQQLRQAIPDDNIGQALTEALHEAIQNEIRRQQRPPHHFVNFAITANGFQHAYQTINFTVEEFLNRTARIDELLHRLASKLNSNESFNPSEGFSVEVVFKMPGKGKGRKKNNPGQRCLDKENKRKKCIIPINNQDDLCCARAIVTMKAYCHKNQGMDEFRKWENLKRGLPVQEKEAKELHRQAGVPEEACGLPELEQFQEALGSNYQLLVMARMYPFHLIYYGPTAPQKICLLKSNEHYDGVTSFSAFTNRGYYCFDCQRAYNTNDKSHHSCRGKRCTACSRFDCPDYVRDTQPEDHCTHCNTKFFGVHCKNYHFASNQCETHKTCRNCYAQYMVIKGKRHRCGFTKCNVCKEYVNINDHRCYIQAVVEKEAEETEEPTEKGGGCMVAPPPPLMVYADIEAMQNEENVFIANLLCYATAEEEDIHVIDGDHCVLNFLQELDDLAEVPDNNEQQREVIVVFHNLKGFDGMFIINELYNQQRQVINQLTVGAKVLSFASGPLKFIDSLCFLPMPLASFPATFNLSELKKGFFPHLFNTPENQQYVGRIPDLEFYDPDSMMSSKKEELINWHVEQVRRNVQFNFKEELIAYCKSDVNLLKQGCQAFQREFHRETGFNPMEEAYTIASACNLYWRKHHLQPKSIAVEPIRGWRGAKTNQSLKALQWLYFMEAQIPKQGASCDRIKHVRNGGEQSIRTAKNIYFVDGLDDTTKTVYEFLGCIFHGCPTCYPMRDIKHYCAPDRTVQELYNATEAKRTALLNAGYNVFECWECQWDEQLKKNAEVQSFLASFDLVAPLNPRDAFYGGRTEAIVLHSAAGEGEEIRYADITSLYPYVNKTCTYPIGHPQIITQPMDQSIHSYFGIALVDILPPTGLFHPVLPVRAGGKLTFPLCSKCVKDEQEKPMLQRVHYCMHTDVERMLRGTWCTPEIEKAVEKGYVIKHIHEVWHFPESQRKTGLFAEYVNKWLKTKQEASGWPSWCVNIEQKRQYIKEYQEREGIRLDISKIAKNPGRKSTAKLMLNRYLLHVFFFHVVIPPFSSYFFFLFSFLAVFGGSLGNVKTNLPPSLFKTLPNCLVYYLIPPKRFQQSEFVPMTSSRQSTQVLMKMHKKAQKPTYLWRLSRRVMPG